MAATETPEPDAQVLTLRKILNSEQEPLARRFRALFSLKYLASLQPEHTRYRSHRRRFLVAFSAAEA